MLAQPLELGAALTQGSGMTHQDTAPARGEGDVGHRREAMSLPADAMAAETFKVEFGLRVGLNSTPADSFKFVGNGSIVFDGDTVTIAGGRKRPFMTSLKETHRFARQEIINAALSGKIIRFQVRSDNEPLRTVQLSAATVPQGVAILSLLPAEQTQEFANSQAAITDFHRRLDHFSPRAPVTPTLVALNVAVFLAMCIGGMNIVTPDGETAVRWGSNFGPMTMSGQWWRLFTATFIHFGIIHLALNMWALFQNGRTIERLFGSTRFLLLYVFAGLSGSIASLLWNPGVNSAGASGAIFGVFGGLLAFVINPRNDVPKEVMAEHRNSTLLFAGYSLFYGFAHSGIDNAAHLGGLAGGFAMGLLLARPLNAEHRARPGLPRMLMAVAAGAAVLLAMAWPLANPSSQTQQIVRFKRSLLDFDGREKAVLAQAQALIDQAKAGKLSNAAFAAAFSSQITPQWDAFHQEFAAETVPQGDSDYALHQALLHYTDARRQEARALTEAVTSTDPVASAALGTAQGNTQVALEEIKAAVSKQK
jgi:rhomboid protease GluP